MQIRNVYLDEKAECILYACAVSRTGSAWTYKESDLKGMIVHMLQLKRTNTGSRDPSFHDWTGHRRYIDDWRSPHTLVARRCRKTFDADPDNFLGKSSALYQDYKAQTSAQQGRSLIAEPDQLATCTQNYGAMGLSAPVPSPGMVSSSRGSNLGFGQPLTPQSINPSFNSAGPQTPSSTYQYQYQYQYPSNIPPNIQPPPARPSYYADPQPSALPQLAPRGVPPQSTYGQQRLPPSGSSHLSGGYENQVLPLQGNPRYQSFTIQQPALTNPINTRSGYSDKPGSQSGHGQAQKEALGVVQIGNNVFNPAKDYIGKGWLGCSGRKHHESLLQYYGAPGSGRPPTPHAEENYRTWLELAEAELKLATANRGRSTQ